MNRVPKLVLAAALLASIPLAASADGACDHGAPPSAWPPAATYPGHPAPPAAYPVYDPAPPAPRRWAEWRWRERELAEVSAQLRALDARRDRFYAENAWRPGRVRRFERWYAARRAELERRWWELQTVAWR
ncbi:MAG TPA: hypothetical protein VFL83_12755 [Anaeromyxobacter sp.]|nr:hypothetical protein [Anaeromyxobacter sp.]